MLDECHHVTGKSAMAKLLGRLHALPPGAPRPKVLGLTASPGAQDTVVSHRLPAVLDAAMHCRAAQQPIGGGCYVGWTGLPSNLLSFC